MTSFTPTPEQEAIVTAGTASDSSLMVNAFAGCAKSSTSELLAKALPPGPAVSLAFNKKIAEATKLRFPSHFDVLTLNGLGHRAWGKTIGRQLKLNDKKLGALVSAVVKEAGLRLAEGDWDTIRRIASLAMHNGLVPEKFTANSRKRVPDTDEGWQAICDIAWVPYDETLVSVAREVLTRDIVLAYQGEISFDDQVYCSSMFSSTWPKYPVTFIDEAQDLSPLNHIMLKCCSTGRIIAVGDPLQAIYAFRGADSASMSKISALRERWENLPLSTTFRCPKLIVDRVKHHAIGFNAAAQAPSGRIVNLSLGKAGTIQESAEHSWSWSQIEVLAAQSAEGTPAIAVLCRNNAPLLSLAFKLLRQNISIQMLGRDIGKGLQALLKRIVPDSETPAYRVAGLINEWRASERQLAVLNDNEEKLAGIEDRAECLLAILEGSACSDARGLLAACENLFSNAVGRVVLSTGHKAKGLEWNCVVHLDPWRIPSKYARKAAALGQVAQLQQELNLEYVIETRTKHTLVLANLEDFQ